MTRLIDIKLERQEAPLGIAILSVYFVNDLDRKVGYQWPLKLGASPEDIAVELHRMAFGIEKQFTP